MRKQADQLAGTIAIDGAHYALMQQLADTTHHYDRRHERNMAITKEMRDDLADFDDSFRPVRNYFYCGAALLRHPHLLGDEICIRRNGWRRQDHRKAGRTQQDLDNIDTVMPQLLALLPPQIDTMKSVRTMLLTMHSTMSGIIEQMEQAERRRDGHGQGFRCRPKRRFLLPAARGVRQPGLPARHEAVPVTGREGGALHHHAQGRSRDGRGYRRGSTR